MSAASLLRARGCAVPRAWRRYLAFGITSVLTLYLLISVLPYVADDLHLSSRLPSGLRWTKSSATQVEDISPLPPYGYSNHPIDHLIRNSRLAFKELLGKRSFTLEQAASRYRERRGRHPPPGFAAWFAAARKSNAIIVEEFFDRIHHDINPFWALEPRDLRVQAHSQADVIRVRDGKVTFVSQQSNHLSQWQIFLDWLMPQYRRPLKIELWAELLQEMMPYLPDLDMAVNLMDETRILVPWTTIDKYTTIERKTRGPLKHPENTTYAYSGLADVDGARNSERYEPKWVNVQAREYWDVYRAACPPDTPARNFSSYSSFTGPVKYPDPPEPPAAYTFQGFVRNFSASQDPCLQPHLRGMHGTFIESISVSTTRELYPLFAETKIRHNNEILIPAAAYLTQDALYSGGSGHGGPWAKKRGGLIWRGVASGGRNKEDTWWHFHRHRWVQLMNSSTIAALEAGDARGAPSVQLAPASTWTSPDALLSTLQKEKKLGEWLSGFSDVAFTDLNCWPEAQGKECERLSTCKYTAPYFAVAPNLPMKAQYDYKYLPDVDGNSFSGRWRGFLLSTSLPLKATIYSEWHDDRLFPWIHFVPFDSTYMDIYAVMDYFLNDRDAVAAWIAEQGRQWAEKVYRRDDMVLYVWRLLLEYARVVDDNRDRLAFVEDLR